jgi:hypothetical protein
MDAAKTERDGNMIQVCEPCVEAPPVRRLSAEEFCALARRGAGDVYRPRWEVLRMLAVGEAGGAAAPGCGPAAALLVLPLDADVSLAAGLRAYEGGLPGRGYVLTPPLGEPERLPALLNAAVRAARRRAPESAVHAVLETGAELENALAAYFSAGFALRALRPLSTLAPQALLSTAPLAGTGGELWLPLADPAHLALALARGWAAVEGRGAGAEYALRLIPAAQNGAG